MFKNLKTWHWIAIGLGVYFLYRWYTKRNSEPTVSLPVSGTSETTLDPSEETNENTDKVVANTVTRVIS